MYEHGNLEKKRQRYLASVYVPTLIDRNLIYIVWRSIELLSGQHQHAWEGGAGIRTGVRKLSATKRALAFNCHSFSIFVSISGESDVRKASSPKSPCPPPP